MPPLGAPFADFPGSALRSVVVSDLSPDRTLEGVSDLERFLMSGSEKRNTDLMSASTREDERYLQNLVDQGVVASKQRQEAYKQRQEIISALKQR